MKNRRGRRISFAMYEITTAPLYCVLTRVHLRSFRALPFAWWSYGQVQRQARQIPQLKRTAFLIQDLRTFFILSIWEGEEGILDFGTRITSHVAAARWSFTWMARRYGKPEVWSTQWRIYAVSNNLNWSGYQEWANLQTEDAEPAATPVYAESGKHERE